jgi:ABC-type lipoprotein export system ATPase subunit
MAFFSRSSQQAATDPAPIPDGPLVSLRNIEKSFPLGASRTWVLRRIAVDIQPGEFVSIMGPSGAGKSTLLHIIGMHDSAWTGEYYFAGQPCTAEPEGSRASCTSSTSASCSRAITCSIT